MHVSGYMNPGGQQYRGDHGDAGGTDLTVTLRLAAPRADDWAQAANRAATSIAARLATRLRRGIEVSITR